MGQVFRCFASFEPEKSASCKRRSFQAQLAEHRLELERILQAETPDSHWTLVISIGPSIG